jgi:hypothetical protein
MDVFLAEQKRSSVYLGRVDIPQHWTKEFAIRMRTIRKVFPEITLHYTIEPPVHAKWNLSLQETYQK